jgi:hypothetical protein
MRPIHHALIALTCTTAFSSLLVSPARADGACSVATRDKSNLSVYDSPDEKSLINELRFGRKVDIKDSAKDSQGRAWVKVAGDYNGEYRQWGWVIRQYLECADNSSSTTSSAEKIDALPFLPGTCKFYEDSKLKAEQNCAIFSKAGSQITTLFWEDNVKTKIDTVSSSVDSLAARNIQDGDWSCYQIQENGKRICYKTSQQKPRYLNHVIGLGTKAQNLLIGNVRRNSHKLNGKSLNTASLYRRIGDNFGGKYEKISDGGITYIYASCSARTLGFSSEYGKAPRTFDDVPTDDTRYSIYRGKIGHYFDLLCE